MREAREALIEKLARQICVNNGDDPDELSGWADKQPLWKTEVGYVGNVLAALSSAGLAVVPVYQFDTDGRCDGRPRIIDLCYTAFQRAREQNSEDGGPTDWFNDTKPMLDKAIGALLPLPPLASGGG